MCTTTSMSFSGDIEGRNCRRYLFPLSTDVVGSSSGTQQQQQQNLSQKIKRNTYEAIHPPTMTSWSSTGQDLQQ